MTRLPRLRAASLILLLLLIPTSLLHAQADSKRLAHSTITLTYDSPPRPNDTAHYRITIKPDRSATLWYIFGPGDAESFGSTPSFTPLNPKPPTVRTFQLTPAAYQTLLDTLASQGILATDWLPNQPRPIGGPRQIVTLTLPSRNVITLTIPPLSSTLKTSAAIRFVHITEAIRAAIPDTAWIAFNKEQQAYNNTQHP
jgi:hypothetical protein